MALKRSSTVSESSAPIGVFGWGLGGLTIVKEIRKRLPNEAVVYFGDIARLPYGIKSRRQIQRFSIEDTEFLKDRGVKAVLVACNSSASAAYELLKRRYALPVVDVIQPAVDAAIAGTAKGVIGVIGTQATIASGAYAKALKKREAKLRVLSKACPLFVPLVEEGWLKGSIAESVIREYLKGFKKKGVDTLILGCTHYPLLKKAIAEAVGPKVKLVDSAAPATRRLEEVLVARGLRSAGERRGALKIYVSDLPRKFVGLGQRFLAEDMSPVKVIRSG